MPDQHKTTNTTAPEQALSQSALLSIKEYPDKVGWWWRRTYHGGGWYMTNVIQADIDDELFGVGEEWIYVPKPDIDNTKDVDASRPPKS